MRCKLANGAKKYVKQMGVEQGERVISLYCLPFFETLNSHESLAGLKKDRYKLMGLEQGERTLQAVYVLRNIEERSCNHC